MRISLSICAFLFLIQHLSSQNRVVKPRDESQNDPSLAAFVANLKNAIDKKDGNWIKSVLDEKVVSSYHDEEGVHSFLNYWTPENDSTDFWPYLKMVVAMGGVFLHDPGDESAKYQFVYPYAYDVDLNMEDDPYLTAVITGENVNLRTGPTTKSDVITKLSYDVVLFIFEDDFESASIGSNPFGQPEWYLVETYDKKHRGWVNWQYVYSLLGPRLFLFRDNKANWKISAFVEGD